MLNIFSNSFCAITELDWRIYGSLQDLTVPLSVSTEEHMSEDASHCFASVTSKDAQRLDEGLLLLQGRCVRLMRVLRCNMEENPARYAGGPESRILSAVEQLKDKGLCGYFRV